MYARAVAAAALLVLAVTLAPGLADRLAPPAAAQGEPTYDATMKGKAFLDAQGKPNPIVVLKGTLVRWTNQDSVAEDGLHSVTNNGQQPDNTSYDKTAFPREFAGTPVNFVTQKFNKVGVYKYKCKYHEAIMKGTVVVVASFDTPVVPINAKDNFFEPKSVTINATQKLNYTNKGEEQHSVLFEDDSVTGGELAPGATVQVTIGKEGIFRYRCTYHSDDFESGMVGEVAVGNATVKRPPAITIQQPAAGATVSGVVDVRGTATAGQGGVNVTAVQVRAGANGAWATATRSGQGWSYDWATESAPNGPTTLFARALSDEFPNPSPASVEVTVANADNATTASPTTSKDGGGTPGPEAAAILAAALVAGLVLRRRRA